MVPLERSLLTPVEDSHPERAAILEAERRAVGDVERPGSWFGDAGADGRLLTQDATDMYIRDELWTIVRGRVTDVEREELLGILGPPRFMLLTTDPIAAPLAARAVADPDPDRTARMYVVTTQRGGIDSDPLVRLLAYRAWGDRDRRWFQDRGVRRNDAVSAQDAWVDDEDEPRTVALAQQGEAVIGFALHDARPGESVEIEPVHHPRSGLSRYARSMFRVSARPRAEAGDRSPARRAGPSFEERMCQVFGFDTLVHEAVPERRWTILIATSGSHRTATRISDARQTVSLRDERYEACRVLAVELRRLGAAGVRLNEPHYAVALWLGIPPAAPAPAQTDPAITARLFIDFHQVIAAAMLAGLPASEIADDLARSAPTLLDEAHQLVAMATTAQAREHEEILMRRPGDPESENDSENDSDPAITIDDA